MPELPDVTVYVEALAARVRGARLERVRLLSPFVLRSVDPPPAEAHGRAVVGLRRLGKRIVLELEGGLFVVVHLMIAGRFHWRATRPRPNRRTELACFEFPAGFLQLSE
ncbi:MAG TPA: DNA-formamidopyrimidine glycosylase family protein, partial [Methylomirabilota bacterium]|nr:DNA-formamidopyrimidine glycosylase family protein [Methylomirabilota bacterium]